MSGKANETTENEKLPGTDGVPADFYKVFWKDIAKYYVRAMNCAYKFKKSVSNATDFFFIPQFFTGLCLFFFFLLCTLIMFNLEYILFLFLSIFSTSMS